MTERSIFLDALDIPNPSDRAAFLDRKCGPDADLRRRVDALLAAHAAAGEFLEPPSPERTSVRPSTDLSVPADPARTSVRPSTDPMTPGGTGRPEGTPTPPGSASPERPTVAAVGTIIAGRYKLLERLGEGGMGEVWLAEQSVPVRRKVALKLIRTGQDSRTMLARFEVERQALAMMDHPNIAKVLDAGATADGHPYFVMELVKGVPITEFCDARRLTPRQRLELFIPVCQAIQHAHQKGIIHRDIKPSNVLVALYDDKPVPKVIDFGVAKATGQPLTENTLHTAFQAVVGTLRYMSPEQATFNQLDIDTRSDVYSLGVLLYELLTGTTPVEKARVERAAMLEMLRVVREEEPPRPSARLSTTESRANIAATRGTEPARLSKLLRGELDWIVMKSLEKDRARRYETATYLARDVERYLADEVVEARPPSVGYRARKFLRKHRGPVIAAGLVLITLLAGITATTIGLLRAESHRVRAQKADDRARDVLDTMTSEITGDSLATQKEITAEQKKFLTEVLKYYKEFAGEKGDDELSRKRIAMSAFSVGLIEYRLGRKEESAVAVRLARDGFAALAADFPTVPEYRADLASSHFNLGLLLKDIGKSAEAEEHYCKAMALWEKLAADLPAIPKYRSDLASSHSSLGVLFQSIGKVAEAEKHSRNAVTILEALVTEPPAVPEYRSSLGMSHNNLGRLLYELGEKLEAEEQYRKALAIQETLVATFPTRAEYQSNLSTSHSNLGALLNLIDKQEEAEEHYRNAMAIQEKLAAEFPAVPEYRSNLAKSYYNLGNLLNELGKQMEAEVQYRKALALREKLTADFPAVPEYGECLVKSHHNLGNLLCDLQKWSDSEEQYRKAVAITQKLAAEFPAVPEYRSSLAKSHFNLGNLLVTLQRCSDADRQYRKALAIREKLAADFPTVPEYGEYLAKSHHNLGNLLVTLQRWSDAEEQYRKALTIWQKLVTEFPAEPEYRLGLALSHSNRGVLLQGIGKWVEAEEQYRKAVTIFETLATEFLPVPEYRANLVNTHHNLGLLLTSLQQWSDAEEQYRQALTIQEKLAADFPGVPEYRQRVIPRLYHFACFCAIASGKVADKKQEYADRAMDLLQKAVKAGFKDAEEMAKDTNLDPLRDRADFKLLLESLSKPKPKE